MVLFHPQAVVVTISTCTKALVLSSILLLSSVKGFSAQRSHPAVVQGVALYAHSSWSVEDDWSRLSKIDQPEPDSNTDDIYNVDITRKAATEMDAAAPAPAKRSAEDSIVADMVNVVHHHGWYMEPKPGDVALYDSSNEEWTQMTFEDQLGSEIAMLVRCNQFPEQMLIGQGRALPPLSQEQLNDVSQLMVHVKEETYESTDFFRTAVAVMFNDHAHFDNTAGKFIMDAMGTAQWLAKSIGTEEEPYPISPHDRRVAATISRFSDYGTGYLTLPNFQELYTSAFLATLDGSSLKHKKKWNIKQPTVDTIWRDIRNHNILSPVEVERAVQMNLMLNQQGTAIGTSANMDMSTSMDECEIIEMDQETKTEWERKSSHQLIQLAKDGTTPLWMRDGEFIFIDEESCIGCKQCTHVAPDSFLLLDNGRARTFQQRNTPDVAMGIEACPVNCMHPVSFDELKEMETARDHGDGRTDHRHFGNGRAHTALNVAGIGSDANHKSSWFHYLRNKCYMSKSCPQRGCYNCPNYSTPGQNPYFQAKHQKAEHQRAGEFIDNGMAAPFRKTEDL